MRTPSPTPKGLTFSDIERTAHAGGQRVAAAITADALANAADEQAEFAACPQCRHSTRVTRKKRAVRTLDGPVDYGEPAAHCVACRRDFFFPQRPQLHLDERCYSPEFQHKLTETAARVKSFAVAATIAELWSGQLARREALHRDAEPGSSLRPFLRIGESTSVVNSTLRS